MNRMNEFFVQKMLKEIMNKNKNVTSLIGKGFHGTRTPIPIKRYVLENPKWYTPYTPYQAEISQGRLESLFNYQQMISSITGLPCSNASLLDGGSTAAEVLSMCHHKNKGDTFYASDTMHPYILDILKTKSAALNIDLHICEPSKFSLNDDTSGFMLQYPNTYGDVNIPTDLISEANEKKITASCSTDLLALTKYKSPAEFGFDIAFGTSQRFGVSLYFGGPHAAFLATTPEFLRAMPGRIVGISKDQQGDSCFRLALQSREQHIRKDKATSNICTSQALLANIATFYAIYHGNDGLHEIANSIFDKASKLKQFLHIMNYEVKNENYFDTITLDSLYTYQIYSELKEKNIIPFWNSDEPSLLSFTFDETITEEAMDEIFNVLAKYGDVQTSSYNVDYLSIDQKLMRNSDYLPEKIFNSVNGNETKFMRYVNKLADKDYSLTTGMIPLGSCTMKENSAYQLEPMSWDTVANSHPFLPFEYVEGYYELIQKTAAYLKNITGFNNYSFQSNSGAMGEYSALLCMRKYHKNTRKSILIPSSAHGTNFASATLAGLKVVTFDDKLFNNPDDFSLFVEKYKSDLVGMMVTYPNTNGIFQTNIKTITNIIHQHDGIVYMDGANMNALAGITKPSEIGADVCHLNLHKTFCIPHGGGGPGMGPIFCNDKLAPFLPTHCFQVLKESPPKTIGTITASQWSSAALLTIPFSYFALQGDVGIRKSTEQAIRNANYMKDKLAEHYTIVGSEGDVAHEFIIDVSDLKNVSDVDIAKRLIDYNFHPPTMSWPNKSSLMIEPTESESLEEIDRFIEAMISIKNEISAQPELLKNAPHPMKLVCHPWNFPYTMEQAFYPVNGLKNNKHWPTVSRVDDLYGDKNMYTKYTKKKNGN